MVSAATPHRGSPPLAVLCTTPWAEGHVCLALSGTTLCLVSIFRGHTCAQTRKHALIQFIFICCVAGWFLPCLSLCAAVCTRHGGPSYPGHAPLPCHHQTRRHGTLLLGNGRARVRVDALPRDKPRPGQPKEKNLDSPVTYVARRGAGRLYFWKYI